MMMTTLDSERVVWFCRCLLTTVVCLVSSTRSVVWPPVYWNSTNPMFKTGHNIQVELDDEIDFFCPFYSTSSFAGGALNERSKPEYYIVYQVSRKEYDSCQLLPRSAARPILNCSNPLQRKRFTILFEIFQAIPNVSEFEPGSTYYYITTSTGQKDGLLNTKHGACRNHNMKLVVNVCCESSGDEDNNNNIMNKPPPPETAVDSEQLWFDTATSRRLTAQFSLHSPEFNEPQIIDSYELLSAPVHDSLLNNNSPPVVFAVLHRLLAATVFAYLVAR